MTDQDLTEEIAGMLVRIESNWTRETSGPGSRFEGKRLEVAQAEGVLRRVAELAERVGATYTHSLIVRGPLAGQGRTAPFADLLTGEGP